LKKTVVVIAMQGENAEISGMWGRSRGDESGANTTRKSICGSSGSGSSSLGKISKVFRVTKMSL
jgi:hypothetical protein